jgi:hypothetical protein
VQISVQNLLYQNKECSVLIFRDVSKLKENSQL